MNLVPKFVRLKLLALSPEQTSFNARGFRSGTGLIRKRLEAIGSTFVKGCNLALERGTPELAGPDLNAIEFELRGFAFEGAAMAFALLDWLTPWRRDRFDKFIHGSANDHIYMAHVGAGWTWARLPGNFRRAQARLDPVLGWLAFDGWGFHEGFFHWPKYIAGKPAPKKLDGYERRVFDHGLGRSLWFVNGCDVELVARTIADFPTHRQGDLWSGIGLGATYAGIISEASLRELRAKAGPFLPQLAQGSVFAAKARQRAGNLTDYVELATKVLCELSAGDAARLADETLENLPANVDMPAYEIWRVRIQSNFKPVGQTRNVQ